MAYPRIHTRSRSDRFGAVGRQIVVRVFAVVKTALGLREQPTGMFGLERGFWRALW